MRAGMAQDLSAVGSELPALVQAGHWSTSAMPPKYTEAQATGRGAVAGYYCSRKRVAEAASPKRPEHRGQS